VPTIGFPARLKSRHCARLFMLPDEWSDEYAEALLSLLRQERPDLLLPFISSPAASANRDRIEALTRIAVPAITSYRMAADKRLMLEACARLGVPCCRIIEADEAAARLRGGDKVVVRPRRDVGGGEGVSILAGPVDLDGVTASVAARFGGALVTDYVAGPDTNMRSATLMFDRGSRLVAYFTHRKVRLWPPRTGIAALSVSSDDSDLVDAILPLFRALEWIGPAEAEFKIDAVTGEPRLLEINPRLAGTLGFAIACGVDFARLWCEITVGTPVKEFLRGEPGRVYVHPTALLRSLSHGLLRGDFGRDCFAQLRGRPLRRLVPLPYDLGDPGYLLGKLLLRVGKGA
jgi:biotin carboxylase